MSTEKRILEIAGYDKETTLKCLMAAIGEVKKCQWLLGDVPAPGGSGYVYAGESILEGTIGKCWEIEGTKISVDDLNDPKLQALCKSLLYHLENLINVAGKSPPSMLSLLQRAGIGIGATVAGIGLVAGVLLIIGGTVTAGIAPLVIMGIGIVFIATVAIRGRQTQKEAIENLGRDIVSKCDEVQSFSEKIIAIKNKKNVCSEAEAEAEAEESEEEESPEGESTLSGPLFTDPKWQREFREKWVDFLDPLFKEVEKTETGNPEFRNSCLAVINAILDERKIKRCSESELFFTNKQTLPNLITYLKDHPVPRFLDKDLEKKILKELCTELKDKHAEIENHVSKTLT